MARWDEIMSLPVQSPPALEFSSSDLVWSKVEGWRDKKDRIALIPFPRVDDFLRGESSNKECPTRFHVQARRRQQPKTPYKPKVDGILEYILYWCSFGPDDHRNGGLVRPNRINVSKKKNAGRLNTKRGCTCLFIVKQLIAETSMARIIYNQDKHVNRKRVPCHGPQDKMAAGTRAMFAPCISEDLLLRMQSLLYVGKQGGPSNRDDLLTHRYVRMQERVIRRSLYELDANDAVSISIWVENHQSHVFFYEDFSDWQLQRMICFGNRSLIASDSRFGTTKLEVLLVATLFSIPFIVSLAIPVAWMVAPKFESSNAHKWMRALYSRIQTKDSAWNLAGFIVDDPLADVLTIRLKCVDNEMQATMSRRLHQLLFEDFIEDFLDESDFMDYFKATCYPRIGMWISALQNFPFASQETSAAMNKKKACVYKRVDWLIDKLGTKVHSYFWLDEYSEKNDSARNWKDEWVSGLTSWRKALKIPDCNIVIEGTRAKVIEELDQENAYVVWNPGLQFGICNCCWAEMGNLCEHLLKVINVCRKGSSTPSISLLQYHKALIDMLHCPPHDSLIHDQAVSLAVFEQKQLSGLINMESNDTTMDDPINEEVLSLHKNSCRDGDVAIERTKGKVATEPSNLVAQEITGNETDVDPSSICISPPGLHSVDKIVSSSVFSESRQRSLFNRVIEHLSPADNARTNPTRFEDDILNRNSQENTMDEDMNIPSSTMEMETENKNRSTINHPSSADDTASIDGPRDNLVNVSDCSRDKSCWQYDGCTVLKIELLQ
ncbi:unnamed protein product [Malus baccata var. baccata]